MRVNSTVHLNFNRIRQLTQAQVRALEKTAEAVHTEVIQAEIMPRDTGTLQNESTFVDYENSANGEVSLITSTPYARRLYYHPEYDYQKYENAFAQGEWYKPWLKGGINEDFATKAYKKIYRKEADV